MMRTMIAGTIALSVAGAGLALAQSGSQPGSDSSARAERGMQPSAEDMAAFTDARIAALKAGLRLNAEQEKSWPAVESALRDLAKQRAERRKEFTDRMRERRAARDSGNERPRPDLYERLRRGADRMTARANAVSKLADAVGPLYKSLDEGQKRRLAMLVEMGRRHGFHNRGRWDRRGERGHDGWHRRADSNRARRSDDSGSGERGRNSGSDRWDSDTDRDL